MSLEMSVGSLAEYKIKPKKHPIIFCGDSRMYKNVKSWSPFVGCTFDCVYCEKSFKRQAKRRKKWCLQCYKYEPHFHPERLNKIPSAETIFVAAYGDISRAKLEWVEQILNTIRKHENKTFYIQTKNPVVFHIWEINFDIPDNVVLGTTIESNRDVWEYKSSIHHVPYRLIKYSDISKAPKPAIRYQMMLRGRTNPLRFNHKRRYVTIEPILDFDLDVMLKWIRIIKPEFVYVGYDDHESEVDGYRLPEPILMKTVKLIESLSKYTEVRVKRLRPAWFE